MKAEVTSNFQKRKQLASFFTDAESTILQTFTRKSSTVEDLSTTLGLHPNEINKYIETLMSRKMIYSEILEQGMFFKAMHKNESR
ncbi:MAG TPA: hypothetical protein VGD14_02860 [bacterium]